MGTPLTVAIVGIVLTMLATEFVWHQRKVQARDSMLREWDTTEASIKRVLTQPGRQDLIRDVVLRARAQQAQLDHLCQATASALNAPAAVITVVEIDGQRWLAHYGADWCRDDMKFGLIAPLGTSYCKYVVTSDTTLIITNSLKDIRIQTSTDTKTRSAVQAYIGAPVHTADGVPVGSLCVFDNKPRKWTKRDRVTVESFASLVKM